MRKKIGALRKTQLQSRGHDIPAYTLTIAQGHCVEAGTHRTESETGTMEKRRDGTRWGVETIKPRRGQMERARQNQDKEVG